MGTVKCLTQRNGMASLCVDCWKTMGYLFLYIIHAFQLYEHAENTKVRVVNTRVTADNAKVTVDNIRVIVILYSSYSILMIVMKNNFKDSKFITTMLKLNPVVMFNNVSI